MKSTARCESDNFEAIHSTAQGLHRAGSIDQATMRELDDPCLTLLPAIRPEGINRTCERAHVGQPVTA